MTHLVSQSVSRSVGFFSENESVHHDLMSHSLHRDGGMGIGFIDVVFGCVFGRRWAS